LNENARQQLAKQINSLYSHRTTEFANGRTIRKLFEQTVEQQASRLADSPEADARLIMDVDIPNVM
jgi:hypothetical protein